MGLFDWLARRRFARDAHSLLGESQRAALKELERRLSAADVPHALIGGVAMGVHGAVRATRDIDFLAEGEREPVVHGLMTALGFEAIQRTPDVSSYLLGRLRVDVLYARREASRAMLQRAIGVTLD